MNVRSVMVKTVLVCGLVAAATPVMANELDSALSQRIQQLESRMQQLQSENQQMKQQVVRMEAERGESWLNERRAEEVKALVQEVLADADTRATLLNDGMTAGHNGKNFFLSSADGSFLMKIGGQMQFRYVYNTVDSEGAQFADENLSGFTLRRTKLAFSGHVANPRLGYEIVLAADDDGGNYSTEDFVISYKFDNGIKLKAGQFKLPFLREELVSSKRQLAVDRNPMTEGFTLDRGQGVQLEWSNDMVKIAAMISDGADSEGVDWHATSGHGYTEGLAFTARADVLLCGEWGQAKDFSAWSSDPMGLFVGGAVHYEVPQYGVTDGPSNVTAWTVDGLLETAGFSLMMAYAGFDTDVQGSGGTDYTHHGYLVQAGYFVIPDKFQPFINYNYIDIDDGGDEFSTIGAGFNWYHNKHKAKFTADVIYGLEPLRDMPGNFNDPATDSIGLRDDATDEDGQFALRAQYQLLF